MDIALEPIPASPASTLVAADESAHTLSSPTDDDAGEGPGEAADSEEGDAAGEAGSNAAASRAFGAKLVALRNERNMSQAALAARSVLNVESIRDYEAGKYRPKQDKLWQLAEALRVLPITIGPGATRGDNPPVALDLLLRKKGSRALRLQRLVELVSGGDAHAFAALVGMSPTAFYQLAATEAQLTDIQLEPVFSSLPGVCRPWLLSAEGEPIDPTVPLGSPVTPVVPVPVVAPAEEGPAAVPVGSAEKGDANGVGEGPTVQIATGGAVANGIAAAALAEAGPAAAAGGVGRTQGGASFTSNSSRRTLSAVQGHTTHYAPLGGGQVAEIGTLATVTRRAIAYVRLLAGAGEAPVLSDEDQLDQLCTALHGLLARTDEA